MTGRGLDRREEEEGESQHICVSAKFIIEYSRVDISLRL